MFSLRRAGLVGVLTLGLGAATCTVPPPDGGYYRVPAGPYQRTCSDASVVQGDVLVAICRDNRGRYVESSLRLPCGGDIENRDGRLSCERYSSPGWGAAPEGPYRQTCTNERLVERNLLVAECRTRSGRLVEATLRLPCNGRIENRDGRLDCVPDSFREVPRGSYLRSCTNERVNRRDTLVAECRTRGGRYVESSLRLPCRGDIANRDGRLVCLSRDDGFSQAVPDGPYRRRCRNERVDDGWLVASCPDGRGGYTRATLELPCRYEIVAVGGRLICRR